MSGAQEMVTTSEQDKRELAALVAALKPLFVFYQKELTRTDLMVWQMSLRMHAVPTDAIAPAAAYWMATSKWMASPAELCELVRGQSSGNGALRAFNELWALVESVGPYRRAPTMEPVLAQTVEELGGWSRVCAEMDSSEAYRKRFSLAYAANQKAVAFRPADGTALTFDGSNADTQFALPLNLS